MGLVKGLFYTICRNLINSYDNIPTEYLFLLRDALLMVPIVEYERKKVSFIGSSIQSTASHYGGNSRLSEKTNFENARGTVSICCKE